MAMYSWVDINAQSIQQYRFGVSVVTCDSHGFKQFQGVIYSISNVDKLYIALILDIIIIRR